MLKPWLTVEADFSRRVLDAIMCHAIFVADSNQSKYKQGQILFYNIPQKKLI